MRNLLSSPKYSPRQTAIFMGLFAVIGLTTVVFIFAAGVFSSAEPENGTLANGARQVTNSGASGGKAVQLSAPTPAPTPTATPAPTPTPTPPVSTACPLPKYPIAACTGVPSGTALTTYSGSLVITTAGAVIDGKRITGTLDIRAHDVIIKNSEITGAVVNDNTATRYRFTIKDSTVRGTSNGSCGSWGNGAVGVSDYTAQRVNIFGFPDGFRVAGSNILIEDSFVTVCSANPNDHSDGIQAYGASGGTNITIRHNTIDQRSVTNGAATAPIFVPNDGAQQGNQNIVISIVDNLLAGGGYSLRLYGNLPFSAPAVTGNKIVNGTWEYGPVDVTCAPIGSWSGNATVNYNWTTGQITSQVSALNTCP